VQEHPKAGSIKVLLVSILNKYKPCLCDIDESFINSVVRHVAMIRSFKNPTKAVEAVTTAVMSRK